MHNRSVEIVFNKLCRFSDNRTAQITKQTITENRLKQHTNHTRA